MSRHPDFVPQGVIPAVLLPFHEDLSIDELSFRAHLRDVAAVAGYVLSASGRRYVMVGLVNHPNANEARPALEALIQWVGNDGNEPPPATRMDFVN